MLAAAQQAGGYKIVFEDEEGDEDMLDDMLEDLEDPWMRNPSRELLGGGVLGWRGKQQWRGADGADKHMLLALIPRCYLCACI